MGHRWVLFKKTLLKIHMLPPSLPYINPSVTCVGSSWIWPIWASVNCGIEKKIYLDNPFSFTFQALDNITFELRRIGIYKMGILPCEDRSR